MGWPSSRPPSSNSKAGTTLNSCCLISNEETKRHADGSYFRGRIHSDHRPDIKSNQPCNNLLQQSLLNIEKHNQRTNKCPTTSNSIRRRTAPSCSLTTNRK